MRKYIKKIINLPKRIYRGIEGSRYRRGKYRNSISVLSASQTIDKLLEAQCSFCRFGDGEIAVMRGEGIAFQKADRGLGERLLEILQSEDEGLLVGINYFYLNPVTGVNGFTRNFLNCLQMQRRFLIKNCSKKRTYIDAAITQMYQNYNEYDFDAHFKRLQKLFEGQKVVLICGENVLSDIRYNALDVCKQIQYIYGPSRDAYDRHDELLKKALETDKDFIVCVILGPEAKVLVYDLFKHNRIAWDIGHYLKDYDSYMRQQPRTDAAIEQFFKPD
ncbi:MAG: GT-D fold domain-containing protein [Lachnospiraceae bacterium]|nr:GT-D fold domain-containing protein [Lachnospiraceae bacterium]